MNNPLLPLPPVRRLAPWLLAGLVLSHVAPLHARTWRFAAEDPPLEAEFVTLKNQAVVLDRGNRSLLELPLSSFSPEDQAFVQEAVKAKLAAAAAKAAARAP